MKKTASFVFAIFATVGLAIAGPSKGETSFRVDNQKSKLVWVGKKVTGEHSGTVPFSNGTLIWANNRLKGGSFEINVKELTVTDITDASYNTKLVEHLKNDDFFAVDKFPKASFSISSVTPKGGDSYEILGKLTIKGITHEVKFPAEVKAEKGQLTAKANIPVDRTKYNIKFRSTNFFENLGDKAIDNDFRLDVNLVANAAHEAAKTGK